MTTIGHTVLQNHIGRIAGVPFHPILMHFAARYHGTTYSAFAQNHRVLVDSNIHCMDDFGFDAVSVISDPYRETAAFGAHVTFPAESVPVCREHIVSTREDVAALPRPDVHMSPRTRDRIDGVALYRTRIGDDVPVIGWVEGPLAEACDLAGVNEILLQLALDPDYVRMLMDRCIVTAGDFALAQIDAGADIMGVGDAICSQVSPEMYERFVLPLHRELFAAIHEAGAAVKLHICGNITHLLDLIAQTGADIVDIDWMVDMNTAYSALGDGIVRCGNLDPVSVIQDLPEPMLRDRSDTCVAAETGRPFIFSGGCEVTVNTPHENLAAMTAAAHQAV